MPNVPEFSREGGREATPGGRGDVGQGLGSGNGGSRIRSAHPGLILLLFLLFPSPGGLSGQVANDPGQLLLIPRASAPLPLDGRFDKPAWQGIEPLGAVMMIPEFGAPPSERTEFRLQHDGEFLYFSCMAFDSRPEELQAASLRRDELGWNSDRCMIYLDSLNDDENSLGFITTPAGVRTEVAHSQDGVRWNSDWNVRWDVAVLVDRAGWHAEFRIPFSSLLFQPDREGRVEMGLSLLRSIPRKNERIVFPAIPPRWGNWSHARSSSMRKVVLEGVAPVRGIDLTPFSLGGVGRSAAVAVEGGGWSRDSRNVGEVGGDVRVGMTSNLTLDLTVNPDFAQVEADDQQVNLTRFSLFFPEKRRFFQERASTFEFSLGDDQERVFHSRQMGLDQGAPVRIYGGARVVGRIGGWDVGGLSMQVSGRGEDPQENQSVLRLRRQVVNANSYLGVIVTGRTGKGTGGNAVVGGDGVLRLFGEEYLGFAVVQSSGRTRGPDASDSVASGLDRSFLRMSWERPGEEGLTYRAGLSQAGPGFEPELGFLRSRDFQSAEGSMGYGWRLPAVSRLRTVSLSGGGTALRRQEDSVVESAELHLSGSVTTRNAHQWSVAIPLRQEDLAEPLPLPSGASVPGGEYRFGAVRLVYAPPQGALLRTGVTVEKGSFFDGERLSVSLRPTFNLSRHLSISGAYSLDRLDFPERGERVVAHVGRVRTEAWFSASTSALVFAQYNSVSEVAIVNFRFRYSPQEGRDLHVVWNEALDVDRHRSPVFSTAPRSRERTLLVKYSYPFRVGY